MIIKRRAKIYENGLRFATRLTIKFLYISSESLKLVRFQQQITPANGKGVQTRSYSWLLGVIASN